MFGVVPKPLWERRIPADERNRIPMGMRCLLVEHDDGLVLIDTGSGNKETDKFHEIYGIENAGADGRTHARGRHRAAGLHAGRRDARDQYAPALRSRRRQHVAHADRVPCARRSRMRATSCSAARSSRRPTPTSAPRRATSRRTGMPIVEAGRFDLVEGEPELRAGHSVCCARPATRRTIRVCCSTSAGETACLPGDVVPDAATCRCPGSWATTSSRWSRSSPSARCWRKRRRATGCWCSSTMRTRVGAHRARRQILPVEARRELTGLGAGACGATAEGGAKAPTRQRANAPTR